MNWKTFGQFINQDTFTFSDAEWANIHELEFIVYIDTKVWLPCHWNNNMGSDIFIDGFYYDSVYYGTVAFKIDTSTHTITRCNSWWNIVINNVKQTRVEYFVYYR